MAGRRKNVHAHGAGPRRRCWPRTMPVCSSATRPQVDRSRYLHARPRRRMDSPHRQAFRLRFLGGSPGSLAAKLLSAKPRPSQTSRKYSSDSRDHGLAPSSLNQIAREWAPRLSLGEDEVRSYLTESSTTNLIPAASKACNCFTATPPKSTPCPPRQSCPF